MSQQYQKQKKKWFNEGYKKAKNDVLKILTDLIERKESAILGGRNLLVSKKIKVKREITNTLKHLEYLNKELIKLKSEIEQMGVEK